MWYQQARASKIPIDGVILQEKVQLIALIFSVENFTASNGWATRFMKRHCLVYKKLCGESAAVNEQTTDHRFSSLPKILEEHTQRR
ncbi:hypothetical protein PR048_003448 [Dryococelus australis]|uniref:HTH CENPB-type domain-containing protein n=1 Tax=Dryococelus australis TaxID=614101 RepID=A0ABQ9IQ22_9NEOP|nr:hypothetical protein PR048_003448 [Dryococelus australis]